MVRILKVIATPTIVVVVLAMSAAAVHAEPEPGSYGWPVRGPVLRTFEAPATPFSAGHRGIDIGTAFGTAILAPADGVVAFAGWVAGSQFISIDHPDGVRTTFSWLSGISVTEGEAVVRSQRIGTTGHGHPEESLPHLHFGARIGDAYIDPLLLLERGSVAGLIRLAPLDDADEEPPAQDEPSLVVAPASVAPAPGYGTSPPARAPGARSLQ